MMYCAREGKFDTQSELDEYTPNIDVVKKYPLSKHQIEKLLENAGGYSPDTPERGVFLARILDNDPGNPEARKMLLSWLMKMAQSLGEDDVRRYRMLKRLLKVDPKNRTAQKAFLEYCNRRIDTLKDGDPIKTKLQKEVAAISIIYNE